MHQDPLHVLWVEPHFPGRLGALADWLVRRRGYRCWFYCHTAEPRAHWPASVGHGLEVQTFGVGGVARERTVAWWRTLERSLCYSYGCWEVLERADPGLSTWSSVAQPGSAPRSSPRSMRRLRHASISSIITSIPTKTTLPARSLVTPRSSTRTGGVPAARSTSWTSSTATWPGPRPIGNASSTLPSIATTSGSNMTAFRRPGPQALGPRCVRGISVHGRSPDGPSRRGLASSASWPGRSIDCGVSTGSGILQTPCFAPGPTGLHRRGRTGRPARAGCRIPQSRLSRFSERLIAAFRSGPILVPGPRTARPGSRTALGRAICISRPAGPIPWPGHCSRRWGRDASCWPRIPSRTARS